MKSKTFLFILHGRLERVFGESLNHMKSFFPLPTLQNGQFVNPF